MFGVNCREQKFQQPVTLFVEAGRRDTSVSVACIAEMIASFPGLRYKETSDK